MENEYNLLKLIPVSDFATMLRKSIFGGIGLNKIYALCKQEGFPSIQLGDRYYVIIDKVNDWLIEEAKKKKLLQEENIKEINA